MSDKPEQQLVSGQPVPSDLSHTELDAFSGHDAARRAAMVPDA